MKVWYVTMIFPAKTETFACSDVRALVERGIDISVHTLRPPRPRQFERRSRSAPRRVANRLLADRGLSTLDVDWATPMAVLRGLGFGFSHPVIALQFVAWILRHSWRHPRHLSIALSLVPRSLDITRRASRERPDVVHLFWGHYPALVGYLVSRLLPDTVVSMFLGAYDLERGFPGSALVAQRAHLVWTHAKANIPDIVRMGVPRERVRVVYRGIDLARFRSNGRKHRRQIVTAGRLIASKAMDDAITVLAELLSEFPDVRLTIYGSGPERTNLEALAQRLGVDHAVEFCGHVSHDEMARALAKAEVFLFTSRKPSERLPNAVKEAMASGCYCVVTDTPGIEELVEHGVTGAVVAQGDVGAARECIADALRNPGRAQEIAGAAREHIATEFDVHRSMARYHEGWREHLTNAAPGPRRGRDPVMAG